MIEFFFLNNHSAVVTSLPLRFCELASVLDSNVIWLASDGEELCPLYSEPLNVAVWEGLSETLVLMPLYREI